MYDGIDVVTKNSNTKFAGSASTYPIKMAYKPIEKCIFLSYYKLNLANIKLLEKTLILGMT